VGQGHSHAHLDADALRSRAGIRTVSFSLVVLGATAAVQALVYLLGGSVALVESIRRLVEPVELTHLWALAAAGLVGFLGNEAAAHVRLRAGRRLKSDALVADGQHARIDGLVSLGVVASAIAVGLGAEIADSLIGLAIAVLILRIAWQAWATVR
jgi:divalent metal cation (Fe/Co/Zn/Cd) transporter